MILGHMMGHHFYPIIQKIQNKVTCWKGKLLSQCGWLILIRYVLSSMVTHIMVFLPVPFVAIQKLNSILSTFSGERMIARAKENGVPGPSSTNWLRNLVLGWGIWVISRKLYTWGLLEDWFFRKISGPNSSKLSMWKSYNWLMLNWGRWDLDFGKLFAKCFLRFMSIELQKNIEGNFSFWFDNWFGMAPLVDRKSKLTKL